MKNFISKWNTFTRRRKFAYVFLGTELAYLIAAPIMMHIYAKTMADLFVMYLIMLAGVVVIIPFSTIGYLRLKYPINEKRLKMIESERTVV